MKSCWNKIISLALLVCPVEAFADINIAIIAPMSGNYKYYSEELFNGAKIAVDEINNRGGLQGEKVNLVPVDDPCDDVLSLSTAQMISLNKSPEDKMYLVIGPHCSNVADQVADLLKQAQIVQIHPTGISKTFYLNSHPNIIRFSGYKEDQARGAIKFIASHYPDQKIAVIYNENNAEMKSIADALNDEYIKLKTGNDLMMVPYIGDEVSISAAVAKIVSSDVGLVYVMGGYGDILSISEQLKDAKDDVVLLTDRYYLSKKFIRKSNELSKDSLILSLSSLKNNPNFASNLVRLRLWGIEPEGLMPYGYLSVKMWSNMVNGAKSFKYSRVLKRLRGKKVDTGWGNVSFDEGKPDVSAPFTVYHVKDGEYTQVQ